MNGLDIAILALAGVLGVLGLLKGLVRILVGLAALVLAFLLAARLHVPVAAWLINVTGGTEGPMRLLAYLGIFFGVLVAGGVLAWLLRALIKVALLSWADRLAGAALGLVAAALAAALLILPLAAYLPVGGQLLEQSTLAPYLVVVADLARKLAPEDMSRRYQEKIDELRRHWRGESKDGSGRTVRAPDHRAADARG